MKKAILALGLLLSVFWLGGCASHKFMPARYSPQGERAVIADAKHVVLCAPFDCVTPQERATYDPRFNPVVYIEGALESELESYGVSYNEASFGYEATFTGVSKVLSEANVVDENSVVLASAIVWFPDVSKFVCDVKVFDHKGSVLFTKRLMCLSDNSLWVVGGMGSNPFNASRVDNNPRKIDEHNQYLRATRQAMMQLFEDPSFQTVLKK